MAERWSHEMMGRHAAREFANGDVINLGVGLPGICCDTLPPDIEVILHSEQGLVGFGPSIKDPVRFDSRIRSMGSGYVERLPGMSFLSHDESFLLVNSGRLDVAVLGALQVDQEGNLANYRRPGTLGGIGGAGDLASHAKRVIVMMTHVTASGAPKILRRCTLGLTAQRCVDLIISDVAVMQVADGQIVLKEMAPGWTIEAIQAITAAPLLASPGLHEMKTV